MGQRYWLWRCMLTVDCQPLQSFARLSECKDQSSWSLENERKESETGRDGTERRAERLAAIQMQEYKHNTHTKKHTHTNTHWDVGTPQSVWHWCCQTNQGTLPLFHLLISVRGEARQLWRCNEVLSCRCNHVWCERVSSDFKSVWNRSVTYFECTLTW